MSDPELRRVDGQLVQRLVEFGQVVEDQLDLVRRLELAGAIATAELAAAIRGGEIDVLAGSAEASTGCRTATAKLRTDDRHVPNGAAGGLGFEALHE